jgi:hypothetical protein
MIPEGISIMTTIRMIQSKTTTTDRGRVAKGVWSHLSVNDFSVSTNSESYSNHPQRHIKAKALSKAGVEVQSIAKQDPADWTKEEKELVAKDRRTKYRRHNSKADKKAEVARILKKAGSDRIKLEINFIERMLQVRRRKNEHKRLRRQRMNQMGFKASSRTGQLILTTRGPIPGRCKEKAAVRLLGGAQQQRDQ